MMIFWLLCYFSTDLAWIAHLAKVHYNTHQSKRINLSMIKFTK
ncbi:hypothetical protein [Moraxella sp. Pampa]|nr:hypothetical protein [Moraxella sp. Pampa]